MFLTYEIFTEWNQEKNTQHTAQQGADEHLHKVDRHFGILFLQDIKSRKRKDGTGYDYA